MYFLLFYLDAVLLEANLELSAIDILPIEGIKSALSLLNRLHINESVALRCLISSSDLSINNRAISLEELSEVHLVIRRGDIEHKEARIHREVLRCRLRLPRLVGLVTMARAAAARLLLLLVGHLQDEADGADARDGGAVEDLDGVLGLVVVGKVDKGDAAGLPGGLVEEELDVQDLAVAAEELLDLLLGDVEDEVGNVDVGLAGMGGLGVRDLEDLVADVEAVHLADGGLGGLLGLVEDKAVAEALAGGLVVDNVALLNGAELGKEGGELVVGHGARDEIDDEVVLFVLRTRADNRGNGGGDRGGFLGDTAHFLLFFYWKLGEFFMYFSM